MKRAALLFAALLASCAKHDEHAGHAPVGSAAPIAADPHAGHTGDHPTGAPSGFAPVTIPEDRVAALGLATTAVEERDFSRALRTVGVVALDETRTAHVHPKVRGWIDGLRVDFVGRSVRGGEMLCSIYSQEVFAAEFEFLAILDRASRPVGSGEFAEAEARAQQQLIGAARRRLSLWDVPKGEIERLERTREARRTFPLLAPRGGVVVVKQAIDGMFVDPSFELYTISDLSRVWLLADVYEADVPYVRIGTEADLAVEGMPDVLRSKIAFLPPTLDEATRTLKARFAIENKAGKLRPGAFASVTMQLALGRGLAVPESAVIRTGTRAIVFAVHAMPDGAHVEPREVHLGPLLGDSYRVEHGVDAGERVATSAQFLIDSESRLAATSAGRGHAGHGGH